MRYDPTSPNDAQLMDDYRETFSGPAGQRVLSDILRMLGFMHPASTMEEAVARNVAISILEILGIAHEENAERITQALLRLPRPSEAKETSDE